MTLFSCLKKLLGLVSSGVLTVLFLGTVLCGNAQATNIIFNTAGDIVGSYVGPRSVVADWVYSNGRSGFGGGARAISVGVTDVATTTGNIRVPTTIGTDFTAARVAGIGVRVARAASVVGVAFTAYDIYNTIKDSGVTTCPPPNFFCMPSPNDTQAPVINSGWTDGNGIPDNLPQVSGQAVCDWYTNNSPRFAGGYYAGRNQRTFAANATPVAPQTASGRCLLFDGVVSENPYSYATKNCTLGYTLNSNGQQCLNSNPTMVPASDAYIQDAIGNKQAADPNFGPRVMNAARQAYNNAPGLITPQTIAQPDLPIDVVSPPVSVPSTQVKTETFTNADGTTSTRTTNNSPTIQAVNQGTNLTNSNIVYNTTNNYTYTTVNNSTGTTKVETSSDKSPADSATPSPVDMPKDYNKEATQIKVLNELTAEGAPVLPNQETRISDAKTANDTGISSMTDAEKNGYQSSKSNWFTWVWVPPTGSCSPFAGNVHSYAVSWDLCPTIANIRDVLGWLFALFGAINIYGTLFKGRAV